MSAYKVGYCPQCQTQIMVRDVSGHYTAQKGNYRQIELVFEDKHRVRTPICMKCLDDVNMTTLLEAILDENSQASTSSVLSSIKERGAPVSWKMVHVNFVRN